MLGAVELGGTKCIAAVANSPDNILFKKEISTKGPKSTFSEIISFFDSYDIKKLGIGSFGPLVLDSREASAKNPFQSFESLLSLNE